MIKKLTYTLSFLLLGASLSSGTDLNVRLTKIRDDGTTYLARLEINASATAKLGTSNFVISFNPSALSFPSPLDTAYYDVYNYFNPPFYDNSNPINVSNAGSGILTINIVLGFNGFSTSIGTGSTWTPVMDLEFDYVSTNVLPELGFDTTHVNWVLQEDNGSANVAMSNGTITGISDALNATWVGTTSAWSTASNWTPSTNIPGTNSNVIIPTSPAGGNFPTLGSDINVGDITLNSSSTLTLSGNQLTVSGTLSGSGVIVGDASAKLVFDGSSSGSDQLNLDQSTPGTTNLLSDLTLNRSNGLTLGDSTEIIGILTLTSGQLTTGGKLKLAATGTTTYGQISGVGSGTMSGNVIMEKFLSNTNAGWRQIALPFTGTVGNLTQLDLLFSSHTPANQRNIYYWDATDRGDGSANGWTAASSSDDQSKVYTVFSDNSNGIHTINQTLHHTGTYTAANHSFAIKATLDPDTTGGSEATGWTLIGNPYPSNLDISSLFSTSFGSVSYKAIHVWDAVNGQYVAICSTGVSITNYHTSGSANSATVIAPFQGFWVKANSDVTFEVQNANRTTSNTGLGTFLKKNYDLVRLNAVDKDGKSDQTVVYFTDQASSGFDPEAEAYKLISLNQDVPSVYAVSPEGKIAITALNGNEFVHTIPLGFRSSKVGKEVTLSLDLSEFDSKWHVYLEDKVLGIFYDIKAKPYTFTHQANSDSRFVLHIQSYALSAEKLVDDVQRIRVTGNGTEVYVFVPAYYNSQSFGIEVIDMMGRTVHTGRSELLAGMNTLRLPGLPPGYYSVRIQGREGTESGKVQLR